MKLSPLIRTRAVPCQMKLQCKLRRIKKCCYGQNLCLNCTETSREPRLLPNLTVSIGSSFKLCRNIPLRYCIWGGWQNLEMFSKLSTELVCLILAQLDNFQDLFSTVRASGCVYDAFRGSKQVILSAVIKNTIDPRVMPDAVAAVRVSRLRQKGTLEITIGLRPVDINDEPAVGQAVLPGISSLVSQGVGPVGTITSLDEAEQLCRLWHSHDYFIKRCSIDFLSKAQSAQSQDDKGYTVVDTSMTTPASSSLSSLELARLQRAFLRYSTFQDIINGSTCQPYTEASSRRNSLLFADVEL